MYSQKGHEARLGARSISYSNALNSAFLHAGPSCSSDDLEQVVGCVCYIGWGLRDTFNTKSLQNECRDQEGNDLEQLNVFCRPFTERENRVPVQRFFEYAKTVLQFCFEQTSVRTTLSSTVVRNGPSEPPTPPTRPKPKKKRIFNWLKDFLQKMKKKGGKPRVKPTIFGDDEGSLNFGITIPF